MECRCVQNINLVALSSVNKSVMSYSYHVIIPTFNEYMMA